MQIPLCILIDDLKEWHPQSNLDALELKTVCVEDVRIVYPDQETFNPGVLYLVRKGTGIPDSADSTFIIMDQTASCPDSANVISLDYPCSTEQLCSLIGESIRRINEWCESLDHAIYDRCELQKLLDLSADYLPNPCLLFNSSFDCLASSSNILESDQFFYEVRNNGQPSPETIRALSENNKTRRLTYGRFVFGMDYRLGKGPTQEDELYLDIKEGGSIILGVTIRFSRVPLSDALIALIGIFASKLQLYYKLNRTPENNTGHISLNEYMFPRLLQGDPQAVELAKIFPAFQDYYMIITSRIRTIRAVSKTITDAFPNSCAFSYKQLYYIFIPVSLFDKASPSYIHKCEKFLSIIGQTYSIDFGLSGPVLGYEWLETACRQAICAIDLNSEQLTDVSQLPHLMLYKNVALVDMISEYKITHPLSSFAPLEYLAMHNDDLVANTDYCSFLKTYLLNSCNATKTAQELFLHKNSVIYRIEKIKERYQFPMDDNYFQLMYLISYIAATANTDKDGDEYE